MKISLKSLNSRSCLSAAISFVILISSSISFAKEKIDFEMGNAISALPPLCETLGKYQLHKCKADSRISRFKCDDIKPPPIYWGALKPHLPMGICLRYRGQATGSYVRQTGCKISVREQYIVLEKSGKKIKSFIIKDKQEFKDFFTPIENGKEALSYIAALTQSYPLYEFPEKYYIRGMDEDGRYTKKNPKPTEVKEKGKGYMVRLFDHTRCGCHRPQLYSVEYFVTKDGYITEKKRKVIWEAARSYQICID